MPALNKRVCDEMVYVIDCSVLGRFRRRWLVAKDDGVGPSGIARHWNLL
jgi:hypothetical protein